MPIESTEVLSLNPNLDAACNPTFTVVQDGTTGLPAFMTFDGLTFQLTVSPGATDYGSYTLKISFTTTYDGMAPSLKT